MESSKNRRNSDLDNSADFESQSSQSSSMDNILINSAHLETSLEASVSDSDTDLLNEPEIVANQPKGIPDRIANDQELMRINSFDFLCHMSAALPESSITFFSKIIEAGILWTGGWENWNDKSNKQAIQFKKQLIQLCDALDSIKKSKMTYQPNFNYENLYRDFLYFLEDNVNRIYEACVAADNDVTSSSSYKKELYELLHAIYKNPCKAEKRSAEMIRNSMLGKSINEGKGVNKRLTESGGTVFERLGQKFASTTTTKITPHNENSLFAAVKNVYSTVNTMMTTRIPSRKVFTHHSLGGVAETSWGMQVKTIKNNQGKLEHQVYNMMRVFAKLEQTYSPKSGSAAAASPVSHIYFNLLAHDRKIPRIKKRETVECERSRVLYTLEEEINPNYVVITHPADKGFLDKKLLENNGPVFSYQKARKRMLDALITGSPKRFSETVRDTYHSPFVYNLLYSAANLKKLCARFHVAYPDKEMTVAEREKECIKILLNKSFEKMGFKPTDTLSPADQQAVFFHCVKFEIPNFEIETLKPKDVNHTCRDGIDRGGVASTYFDIMDSIRLQKPITEEEFFIALYGPAAMVKGRSINRHVKALLNSVDVYINNQDKMNLSSNIPAWLRKWRDQNIHVLSKIKRNRKAEQINFNTKESKQLLNDIISNLGDTSRQEFEVGNQKFILIKREGSKESTRTYYDILGAPISRGRNTVHNVVASVEKLRNGGLLILPSRMVAKQFLDKGEATHQIAMMEKIKDYTHVKKPNVMGSSVIVSSKKMEGQPLNEVVSDIVKECKRDGYTKEKIIKILVLMREVAYALKQLHDQHFIHLDLKSENIIVDMSDPFKPNVKIIDFGISRIKDDIPSEIPITTARITDPEFILREIDSAGKGKVSEANDVYALGILFLELMGGRNKILTRDDAYQQTIKIAKEIEINKNLLNENKYDLFNDNVIYPFSIPAEIKELISQLTQPNSNNRSSLDEGINSIEDLWIKVTSENKMVDKEARNLGFQLGRELLMKSTPHIEEVINQITNLNSIDLIDGYIDSLRIRALYDCHSREDIIARKENIYHQLETIEDKFNQFQGKNLESALLATIKNFLTEINLAKETGNLDAMVDLIKRSDEKLRRLKIRHNPEKYAPQINKGYKFDPQINLLHTKLLSELEVYKNEKGLGNKRIICLNRLHGLAGNFRFKSQIDYLKLIRLEMEAINQTSSTFKRASSLTQYSIYAQNSKLPNSVLYTKLTSLLSEAGSPSIDLFEGDKIEKTKLDCVLELLKYSHKIDAQKISTEDQKTRAYLAGQIAYSLYNINTATKTARIDTITFVNDLKIKMKEMGIIDDSSLFKILDKFNDTLTDSVNKRRSLISSRNSLIESSRINQYDSDSEESIIKKESPNRQNTFKKK